ncbi:nucleoid occlusion protein [Andreesenia angusta]|uniref:Nucleoid occlusion protein n=1 Tax=Andreesenia angusta TaxID=39480 RepID=A0A1S1V8H7_9FIRM|nr:ParB/RepB/Spo0J family partition protein [Andreesenia angusta]OHW62921.1 nucleoid occlusion protein [Andreesenia angusta]
MAKFNLTDLLSESSKKEVEKEGFRIKDIDIEDIAPDERNFYDTSDIEELKASIEMFGLQQNLVVQRTEEGKYTLISGHRRLKAITELVSEGHIELRKVPCKVEDQTEDKWTELQLIVANSTTRELSDYEKMKQATRLKELLAGLKKDGVKLPGRMREMIADALDVSPTQVARMDSIDKNLSDDFKEEFQAEKVNASTAYELSGLPEEKQKEAYEEYKDKGSISIKDVKQIKEDSKLEEPKEEKQKKIYVCSSEGKRFKMASYVEEVVKEGHIPLNAQSILYGVKGIEAEEAYRALCIELISLADEVWVYGSIMGKDVAMMSMVELNIASNLRKKTVYRKGEKHGC